MRVLVTGGAGFIGANLCHVLSARSDIAVVAYDDLSTGYETNLAGSGAEPVRADILDVSRLEEAARGCDAIVHLAARGSVPKSVEDPMGTHVVNATGTLNVLEAARSVGVGHVIVASSSSVYGSNPVLPKSESLRPAPRSPYAASKLATESYALAHQATYGIGVLALRFFNVFGPLQTAGHAYAAVVPAFIDAATRGVPLTVYGDGLQSRDFTFVADVCAIIERALTDRVTSEDPVNLAFGGRITLLELVAMLEAILGRPLAREHVAERPGDVRHSQADQAALRALFSDLVPVPIDEGLRRTVEWFQQGCGPLA